MTKFGLSEVIDSTLGEHWLHEGISNGVGTDNLYAPEHFDMLPYLDNALRAVALYRRDKDYIVRGSEVVEAIRSDTVRSVFSVQQAKAQQQVKPAVAVVSPIARSIRTNCSESSTPQTVRKSGLELGRSDPCWCGCGKKYKIAL